MLPAYDRERFGIFSGDWNAEPAAGVQALMN